MCKDKSLRPIKTYSFDVATSHLFMHSTYSLLQV